MSFSIWNEAEDLGLIIFQFSLRLGFHFSQDQNKNIPIRACMVQCAAVV